MSELTLNLIDSQTILCGHVHGSVADRAIAALSAEPETIVELEHAMARYIKPTVDVSPFFNFHSEPTVNTETWDAGIIIIDLPARVIAAESGYSRPGPSGEVNYHDGEHATDVRIPYRLPDDWRFVYTLDAYRGMRTTRAMKRAADPPLDTRAILYGRPLIDFIAVEVSSLKEDPSAEQLRHALAATDRNNPRPELTWDEDSLCEIIGRQAAQIHAKWLMTPRDDLRNATPREVLFKHQDFLSFDSHTRELQWSLVGEGPPCLSKNSFAYRYAGIGPHEWVVYYDLVRELIHIALRLKSDLRSQLTACAATWIEEPQADYGGYVPAIILENERKRLPMALHPRDMVIDEDCPVCQMMAAEGEMGGAPGFWHLDGAHMDDDFVFSQFSTREEWEKDRNEWETFHAEYERRQQQRPEKSDEGEAIGFDPILDPDSRQDEPRQPQTEETDSASLM